MVASEGRRNWQCLWDLPHIFKKHQSGDPERESHIEFVSSYSDG